MTDQTSIDPFRELNRYDDRDEDWPSSAVYEAPRRTLANGWRKFHADCECGSGNVYYVESGTGRPSSGKYEYRLRCWSCGHTVPEDEILFVGGQWWSEYGWQHYGRMLEDLRLPTERVLDLGPDPDHDELVDALERTRIEGQASIPHMFSFGRDHADPCETCGHDVPIRFDKQCRLCYDGPWTDRLTSTLEAFGVALRERNGSYRHRLPNQLDPFSPGDDVYPGTMLWRRHDLEGTAKLVEVTQRLADQDSGDRYYRLTDPTHTEYWQYHEDDLRDCFWDTGLRNDEAKPVLDDRIREVYQNVCEHHFTTVHDRETGEPAGEQCLHCRQLREE